MCANNNTAWVYEFVYALPVRFILTNGIKRKTRLYLVLLYLFIFSLPFYLKVMEILPVFV